MSRINSKQAAKRETIAYLTGIQEGIRIATNIWKGDETPNSEIVEQLMQPYKKRVDSLNARIEEGSE